MNKIRVTIWNEYLHEKDDPGIAEIYPEGIHGAIKKGIEDAVRFAPLHNPAHLQGIKACEVNLPGKPNVAVFDTAFHQTMPRSLKELSTA